MAMRRFGSGARNATRCTSGDDDTGGFTDSTGSRVMPTLAATIWRRVSSEVARKPFFSPAPAMWQTSSA